MEKCPLWRIDLLTRSQCESTHFFYLYTLIRSAIDCESVKIWPNAILVDPWKTHI